MDAEDQLWAIPAQANDDPALHRSSDEHPASITATYEGTCFGCQSMIKLGEKIIRAPHQRWSHESCSTAVSDRMRSKSATGHRTNPAYSHACPTCQSPAGEVCLTAAGNKRPLHPARLALV